MGEVYRAVRADDEYRKHVAIKVVCAGSGIRVFLNRLRTERQILATLEHSNICRLLDGGTTETGLPYLVMELIEGEPIDEYCRDHKLAVPDILQLFLQVCSAVQYAHQRLIIHRDLKPANILVTHDGTPKLLDFGIAKILDPSSPDALGPTVTAMQALTPIYASPEQVRGEPITTATDVYSLGVVLYELLSGQSPYRVTTHSPHEITKAVCEQEPLRPSTAVRQKRSTENGGSNISGPATDKLVQRLCGDLDNILLMALRKEPQRRYATVEKFAEDIQRHLQKKAVLARQGTLHYRRR